MPQMNPQPKVSNPKLQILNKYKAQISKSQTFALSHCEERQRRGNPIKVRFGPGKI